MCAAPSCHRTDRPQNSFGVCHACTTSDGFDPAGARIESDAFDDPFRTEREANPEAIPNF